MSRFINKLIDDHKYILNQIIQLQNSLNQFKSGKNVNDLESIQYLIHTIKSELKKHQYLEDKILFSKLKQNFSLKRILTTLTAEHMILWDKIDILEEELKNFQLNRSKSNFGLIVDLCNQVFDLLKLHISKEEHDLFPAIMGSLSKEELNELENYLY